MDIRQKVEEAKKKMTEEQYNVCFLKGTEPPFSGEYTFNHDDGMYHCVVCNEALFSSRSKFDSSSGWPSFDEVVAEGKVKTAVDNSHGMVRTEILCTNCGAHLGHLFDDGPTKTGHRYCVNSLSLDFKPKD